MSILIAPEAREIADGGVWYLVRFYCGEVHAEEYADEIVELDGIKVTDDAELATIPRKLNASTLDLVTAPVRPQGEVLSNVVDWIFESRGDLLLDSFEQLPVLELRPGSHQRH